jgi:hypothetical protein
MVKMEEILVNAITRRSIVLRHLAAVLLLMAAALLATPSAFPQGLPEVSHKGNIAGRYPAGSIQSVETADIALAEITKEQVRIEEEYANSEQACYPKFFATSCLDAAKERRRAALALIRPIEVEANAFKRRARVADRDKALAEKRLEEESEAARRSKDQQEKEAATARKEAAAAQKGKKAADTVPPVLDRSAVHEAKLKRLREEDAANAQKRAANVAAYEKKMKEAQARQQEVAAKKAEKERERAAKAAAPATP